MIDPAIEAALADLEELAAIAREAEQIEARAGHTADLEDVRRRALRQCQRISSELRALLDGDQVVH
jgi:hypothetical protein